LVGASKQEESAVPPDDVEPSTRTSSKLANPVTLRLGELEPEIASRIGGRAPSAIMKRDLGRYYAMLTESRRQLYFALPEAEALVFALRGFDAAAIRYLWAEVERQYLANDENPDHPPYYLLPDDLDAALLVDGLRRLTLSQSFALLDAIERYWSVEGTQEDWANVDIERLVSVGLLQPHQAKEGEQRRKAEKGKTTARDPAARLRRQRTDGETE
jgi:hypothetical protein